MGSLVGVAAATQLEPTMVLVYAFVGGELALFFWLGTAARGGGFGFRV